MLTLAINTASSKTAIALLENTEIIAEDSWDAENREAEKLMPAIHNLLKKKNKNYTDIDEIYAIKGPGSFTGLRIGVTVANTLAYLLNCRLFSISAFEYWHVAGDSSVLIYAGKGGLYFSENKNSKPELLKLSEAEQILKSKKIKTVCGDITEDQKKQLKGIKFINNEKSFGEIIKTAIESLGKNTVKMIEPIYIKSPGITQNNNQQKCST
ncbi:tRNA (adenosine(37)-N6)-threonylcarbamoyltransferase complex dimerization subunit type 1 TsaB [Candidatus Peregrinibacteria bacterium RIFCSPLOWO2_01_FULL_39_12]|nr:MAG: tRNA (adenosine(37)-N6)-threonylcarbamoyltransferase complex dimerization subunit type 1 TsaB [Candidatus Peregrinibacteria bacterium RIFCSPLOWO2_01_FULL_39_12]OGJ43756.1 MAG: tRNA (adenosine(37)-N6)-threonylcarbamoyltransferase complex dimerization subunit type 1 TsaB [Candidatus Peregrinibacteria bacterium RIFCSPLOWO2_02_FULL_39_10]